MYSAANHQRDTLTQCFDEGVYPSWLHLLGPASMGWASILAQFGNNDVYKALWLLIPTPMCLEGPN